MLFHKVSTLDKIHTFCNAFTKCCIVLPTTTDLPNVALFRLQQHFYQILYGFAFYNTSWIVAYFKIQNTNCLLQHFTKRCLFSNSKYKLPTATLHKCCLFVNSKLIFNCIFFLSFRTHSRLLFVKNLQHNILKYGDIRQVVHKEFHCLLIGLDIRVRCNNKKFQNIDDVRMILFIFT